MGQNVSSEEGSVEELSWMEDSSREESVSNSVSHENTSDEESENNGGVLKEETAKPLLDSVAPVPCRKKKFKTLLF